MDQFIYDMITYADPSIDNCDVIVASTSANEIIWLFQRIMTLLLWLFPVLYIFWPTKQISGI